MTAFYFKEKIGLPKNMHQSLPELLISKRSHLLKYRKAITNFILGKSAINHHKPLSKGTTSLGSYASRHFEREYVFYDKYTLCLDSKVHKVIFHNLQVQVIIIF